jgi:hypothetical protein
MFALQSVSPKSTTQSMSQRIEESLAVALQERHANGCILVRGCKPVFVLLCDAEELLHHLRSWRCGRPVRIEWPCELAEEAVEFLLAHGNSGYRARRNISECVPDISWIETTSATFTVCQPADGPSAWNTSIEPFST